ncbi:MAG: PspC domain-containing protein [Anaerolineales bacterium]|nr:PspC domain-containing protein [Anaerolineales bacterium]
MPENYQRLYRSRTDRMIGGVCGGLGEYFTIDPTIWRILFILLTVAGLSGVLVYLIMLIVVPIEPLDEEAPPEEVAPE